MNKKKKIIIGVEKHMKFPGVTVSNAVVGIWVYNGCVISQSQSVNFS